MSKMTLSKLCILNIGHMLKEYYWSDASWFSDFKCQENPFSIFPSQLVEDLVATVLELSPKGTLCEKDLRPVITSGRIRHFRITDVLLQTKELVSILTLVAKYGDQLHTLILRKIYCTDYYATLHVPGTQSLRSNAVENLLLSAPNLEHLHIDIPFDLKILQSNKELKHLEIDFVPRNVSDIVPCPLNDSNIVHISKLNYISIYEGPRFTIPKEHIAFLLQHCPDLVWLENSISEALEYLHYEEASKGTLKKKYKLERATLGNAFLQPDQAPSSPLSVQIATVTCPNITELDVLVNNHDAIFALCEMKHLHSLLVQWAHVFPGDFLQGLLVVLQVNGFNLKNLNIINFFNIDLRAIATLCPHLTFLKLELDSEVQNYPPPEECFQYLEGLHIECMDDLGPLPESLLLLLSHCSNLEMLCLDGVPRFTDEILRTIMRKNNFSKLKSATLLASKLTAEGLSFFILNCHSLEFLNVTSGLLSFEEVAAIVQQLNPSILLRP